MNLFSKIVFLISLFTAPAFAAWTPWASLGGAILGDPAACTSRNITYVVARGTDNAIWYRKKSSNPAVWQEWKRIPGDLTFTGSPSVVCRTQDGGDYFEVFALNNNNPLVYFRNKQTTATEFTGWTEYPAFTIPFRFASDSGLTVLRADLNQVPLVFARGDDQRVWYSQCFQPFVCAQSWLALGGDAISDPAATFRRNRLDWIWQISDGRLFHRNRASNGTIYNYGFVPGGPVSSAPEIISRSSNSLDLFVRSTSGTLLHKRWVNGTWKKTIDLGGIATSGPGATAYANNSRIIVFVRGTDGALWYRTWSSFFR